MDRYDLEASDSDMSENGKGSSPGNLSSTQESKRTPSQRHAFLFRHNLNPVEVEPDLRQFHPLPSQIPFLLDIFSENINSIARIIHLPTIMKLIRTWRSGEISSLAPAHEALLFSMYYAAVTSMEDNDVSLLWSHSSYLL